MDFSDTQVFEASIFDSTTNAAYSYTPSNEKKPALLYSNTEETNPEAEIFYTEVDVLVKLSDGAKVIVEVQVKPIKGFRVKRLFLYTAKEVMNVKR